MAHELDTMEDGRARMAYSGTETPWHGLGQQLTEDATLDVWHKEAGMDWNIIETPVLYKEDSFEGVVPGRKVLLRNDTGSPLAVVGDQYKVVQPGEVLDFFADLIDHLGFKMSTAGVLFGGRRFWALADTGRAAEILKNDTVKGNLLLTTACDGTLATTAQFTSIRVVCNNTLRIALGDNAQARLRVSHRTTFDPKSIKEQLGLIDTGWDRFISSITDMTKVELAPQEGADFLIKLLGDPALAVSDQSPAVARKAGAVFDLWQGAGMGSNLDGVQGTLWGLLNGVTEYVDYHTGHRTVDARMDNALWGSGEELKTKAFELAKEYV